MNPELCSSCPTPWKKWFLTEWEAEDRLAIIARHADNPAKYPRAWYICPYMPLNKRGGLEIHYHLTSSEKEPSHS